MAPRSSPSAASASSSSGAKYTQACTGLTALRQRRPALASNEVMPSSRPERFARCTRASLPGPRHEDGSGERVLEDEEAEGGRGRLRGDAEGVHGRYVECVDGEVVAVLAGSRRRRPSAGRCPGTCFRERSSPASPRQPVARGAGRGPSQAQTAPVRARPLPVRGDPTSSRIRPGCGRPRPSLPGTSTSGARWCPAESLPSPEARTDGSAQRTCRFERRRQSAPPPRKHLAAVPRIPGR